MTAGDSRRERLTHALEHIAHVLPDQGPIGVFIHHNTLHAFQHLPFHEAVQKAGRIYGAEPYWSEQRFREQLAKKRITERDLREALDDFESKLPPERKSPEGAPVRREDLRWVSLRHGIEPPTASAQRWRKTESGVSFVEPALLQLCEARVPSLQRRVVRPSTPPVRLRDALQKRCGVDLDELVHPLLIRWTSAYLDEGVSYWPMPQRKEGFFRAIMAQWATKAPGLDAWHRAVSREARQLLKAGTTPEEVVLALAEELGVADEEFEEWLQDKTLALRGWAGMMSRLERHPEDRSTGAPPASLLEFTAVNAVLLRHAARWIAERELEHQGPLATLRLQLNWNESRSEGAEEDVRRVQRLARALELLKLDRAKIEALPDGVLEVALEEIDLFDSIKRRRIFQEAYEGQYRRGILDALANHRPAAPGGPRRSRYQVICCFDEREESFRRHLEEQNEDIETFGAPGFFGLAMYFQGVDDAGFTARCPVAVTPQHRVEEHAAEEHQSSLALRKQRRQRWGRLEHFSLVGARGLVRGALVSLLGGVFAAFPLAARVLVPRAAARLVARSQSLLLPEGPTELTALREPPASGEMALGFTHEELAERIGNILENIGLTADFGSVVAVLGHGATTNNNPHASAYNCGACGGHHGDASARLFASMANHPRVRELLRQRGIDIPDTTWFVGGLHDTCSDVITYYDTAAIPSARRQEARHLQEALDRSRATHAQERCRRFEAVPFGVSPEDAIAHVEGRSLRLDEPRPEFGHATNAVALVGRRSLTRDLFLDRRTFLISYDPEIDETGRILERILAAATPVGAGINLEYYFSCVDNEVYGCGTKLPHNLAGLLGVMNGHAGDLRTGLPLQTVEIHEPMRLLVIVEATPERLLEIAGRQTEVRELVVNGWVQLVSLDPKSGAMALFRDGAFHPYTPEAAPATASSSFGWYQGKREHLTPCRIQPAGRSSNAA